MTTVTVSVFLKNPTQPATIADVSANVSANLAALQTSIAKIIGITLTDTTMPTLTLSAAQQAADNGVLGKITSNYDLSGVLAGNVATLSSNSHLQSLTVADTAADVLSAGNMAALEANIAKISSITLIDVAAPTLSVTSAQLTADLSVLEKITSQYKITLTDSAMPTLTLTAAQQTTAAGVLGKITSNYKLTGITAGNVATLLGNTHLQSLTVADTAANVSSSVNLATLQVNLAKITGITLTDTTTPTLTLTVAQQTADSGVLSKITSNYDLSGVLAGNVATLSSNSHLQSLTVADTSADVLSTGNLPALEANIAKISGITLIDATTPSLSLTAAQLAADAGVLEKISSPYKLTVNGAFLAADVNTAIVSHLTTTLAVADTSANIVSSLASLESNAGQISGITLTDATATNIPTITLTSAQYAANIDALAEISSPYNLVINNSTGIAADKLPPFSIRAPAGSTGTITLTVHVLVTGVNPHNLTFSFIANGATPVQFQPNNGSPAAGESWNISVTATNASGNSLGAGQIEVTPGTFYGEPVSSGYGASLNLKFLSVSASGMVSGLPTTYTSTDANYYILEGASGKSVSLAALTAADTGNSALHQYIHAGRVAIMGLAGAVQPDNSNNDSNLRSPAVVVNGDTIPNLGNHQDGGSYAIMATAANLSAGGEQVDMWAASVTTGGAFLVNSQYLSASQPYAGFNGGNLNGSNGSLLQPGEYKLFFTDASGGNSPGNPIPGLQVGVSSPYGGLPTLSAAPATSSQAITLFVGTVQAVETHAASNPSGTTWYLIEDSINNIQNAAAGLQNLVAGKYANQQLIGAYISGGIAPPLGINGYSNQWPSPVQIGNTQDFVRVFGTDNGKWQVHTVLAVQTSDAANTTHNVQLYDNGKALGGLQVLTADGSSTLGIPLPAGVSLAVGAHSLTATIDGSAVNIGVVPSGGGLPISYAAALNVWVGTVAQLPTTVSAIAGNTLYILQDSAQNLAGLASASVTTGVVLALADSGNLTFEVTGGQLSSYQQQLIEENNFNIVNFSALTVVDTLRGMQHVPVLGVGDALSVHDDVAHLLYDAQAIAGSFSNSGGNTANNPLSNTLASGHVLLVDNLADLLVGSKQLTAQNLEASGVSGLAGLVVSDTLADYQVLSADKSALQGIATNLNATISYEVKDNLADLQQAGGALTTALQSFLQANDANAKVNVVDVRDNVSNLEAAYANGNLSTLAAEVKNLTGHGINVDVKDSIANLTSMFSQPGEVGLYSEIQNVTVSDTAQNILTAIQNSNNNNGNGINPIAVASTIAISDSYANILAASQSDTSLLAEVSKIDITSGPIAGTNGLLQINFFGNNNVNISGALPEVVLSFMSGALKATEASDHNGGTLVTIAEQSHPSVSVTIDLLGVVDNAMNTATGTGSYTQGGWYHL